MTCSPTRRGGSAISTNASRPAKPRTRASTTLGDERRCGPMRGLALRALLLQGPPGDRRRLAAPGPPSARSRSGVGRVRRAAPARGRDGPRRRRPRRERDRGARGRRARSAPAVARSRSRGPSDARPGAHRCRRTGEGLATLDEAMLFAVEGRLRPYSTGKVYCSLISACESLGDLRRAAEWSEATTRWAQHHPLAVFPGLCRVHLASSLRSRGEWDEAEEQAGPRLLGARNAQRAERRRRLRGDRRDPTPDRRPRRRRGRFPPRRTAERPTAVRARAAAARAGQRRRGVGDHQSLDSTRSPGIASAAPGCFLLAPRSRSRPATSPPRRRPRSTSSSPPHPTSRARR